MRHLLRFPEGYGLAPSKDFAVSLPLFCPYGGIGPSTSGWGSLEFFQIQASLLAPLFLRTSAVSGYYFNDSCEYVGVRTFLSFEKSKE